MQNTAPPFCSITLPHLCNWGGGKGGKKEFGNNKKSWKGNKNSIPAATAIVSFFLFAFGAKLGPISFAIMSTFSGRGGNWLRNAYRHRIRVWEGRLFDLVKKDIRVWRLALRRAPIVGMADARFHNKIFWYCIISSFWKTHWKSFHLSKTNSFINNNKTHN